MAPNRKLTLRSATSTEMSSSASSIKPRSTLMVLLGTMISGIPSAPAGWSESTLASRCPSVATARRTSPFSPVVAWKKIPCRCIARALHERCEARAVEKPAHVGSRQRKAVTVGGRRHQGEILGRQDCELELDGAAEDQQSSGLLFAGQAPLRSRPEACGRCHERGARARWSCRGRSPRRAGAARLRDPCRSRSP